MNDSIFLFTKNWNDRSSSLYVCPSEPGEYILNRFVTFPVDGLVTAGRISPDSSFLVLLGYRDYIPFVWIYEGFDPVRKTWSNANRLDFPSFYNYQTEGLAFHSPSEIYISNEGGEFPASVYALDINKYLQLPVQ